GELRRVRLVQLCTLLASGFQVARDPPELLAAVDRADVRVLVHRIADAQRGEPDPQLADHLAQDALLHVQPRSRAADVPLVEVDPLDDPLDRLVEARVLEDDVRALPAELEGEALFGSGGRGGDPLADLR